MEVPEIARHMARGKTFAKGDLLAFLTLFSRGDWLKDVDLFFFLLQILWYWSFEVPRKIGFDQLFAPSFNIKNLDLCFWYVFAYINLLSKGWTSYLLFLFVITTFDTLTHWYTTVQVHFEKSRKGTNCRLLSALLAIKHFFRLGNKHEELLLVFWKVSD